MSWKKPILFILMLKICYTLEESQQLQILQHNRPFNITGFVIMLFVLCSQLRKMILTCTIKHWALWPRLWQYLCLSEGCVLQCSYLKPVTSPRLSRFIRAGRTLGYWSPFPTSLKRHSYENESHNNEIKKIIIIRYKIEIMRNTAY